VSRKTVGVELKKYSCSCGKKVELVFIPGMGCGTWKTFHNMMKSGLCRDCYCNLKVPEAADKIMENAKWVH